mgnify:CR=1 FL=1
MSEKVSGKLVSRLQHPATVSYEGMSLIVPPHSHGKNAPKIPDKSKLGSLPKGVHFVKD